MGADNQMSFLQRNIPPQTLIAFDSLFIFGGLTGARSITL